MSIFKTIRSIINYQTGRLSIKRYLYTKNTYQKIWLVGSPRSGTTWLSNLINYSDKFSYMFEPIHENILKEKSECFVNIYIRPDENSEPFTELFNKLFSHNFYHQRIFSNKLKFKYEGILVKDINANLAVKWVKNNFPDIKIVFLMRHPFAVYVSQEKLSHWQWLSDHEYLYKQEKLCEDFLSSFPDNIRKLNSDFEEKILIWSISHYVPLKQLEEKDCLIVFYEDLCVNPERELKKIFDYINIDFCEKDKKILLHKIKMPSMVSREDSAISNNKDLIDTWRNELSSQQIKSGLDILKEFSLDKIYSENLMPDTNGLKEFLLNKKC